MTILIIILIIIAIFALFALTSISIINQSKKDWATLHDLQEKANKVTTKEEIEQLHKEFVQKASKIHNTPIIPHLNRVDGYLRGLYKQYQK